VDMFQDVDQDQDLMIEVEIEEDIIVDQGS